MTYSWLVRQLCGIVQKIHIILKILSNLNIDLSFIRLIERYNKLFCCHTIEPSEKKRLLYRKPTQRLFNRIATYSFPLKMYSSLHNHFFQFIIIRRYLKNRFKIISLVKHRNQSFITKCKNDGNNQVVHHFPYYHFDYTHNSWFQMRIEV